MINNISELSKKTKKYIKNFFEQCTIEEKIDAYYVTVEIISKNKITFHKSNKKEINRIDMILNEMWDRFIFDWQHFKMVNQEWFEQHIGYKISMFYLPVEKPLFVQYKKGTKYIIDRITYNNTQVDDIKTVMEGMNMLSDFGIVFKDKLNCRLSDTSSLMDKYENDYEKFVLDAVKDCDLFAENAPEGYVLRYNKDLYQILCNKEERIIKTYRSEYEFVLSEFIKHCDDTWNKIDDSYTGSVCRLFNEFINNVEEQNKTIQNNVTLEGIESPCVGVRFDINYKYIPNLLTVHLCKQNEYYKNIFKILLVNLQKEKNKDTVTLMTKQQVDKWNNLVKQFKLKCTSLKNNL